eukprot:2784503-Pyramimonas_sp.AAC.1
MRGPSRATSRTGSGKGGGRKWARRGSTRAGVQTGLSLYCSLQDLRAGEAPNQRGKSNRPSHSWNAWEIGFTG